MPSAGLETPLRRCYGFLDGIHPLLTKDFHNPKKTLKEQLEFHNDPRNDKLSNLQTEIDEVKGQTPISPGHFFLF